MPYFALVADILMIAASAGAATYCMILSRRLSRLTSFDKGIGGAIAVLSAQVDEMKTALAETRLGTDDARTHLQDLVRQARDISGELELMIAACHDFAEEAMSVQTAPPAPLHSIMPAPVPVPVHPDPPTPQPVFGTRRVAAAQPVFVRHGQD
jgi:polyhydroxyalkanoate synthesis regulator phasin